MAGDFQNREKESLGNVWGGNVCWYESRGEGCNRISGLGRNFVPELLVTSRPHDERHESVNKKGWQAEAVVCVLL